MQKTQILPVSRLKNYDVINTNGEDLGQVQNLMLDLEQGQIAFVIVSFGGILGLSDKWFALPWELLAWSHQKKKFILNMPREVLENAPGLDKSKWPIEIDLSWLSSCYAYYRCAPYWITLNEDQTKKLAYSIWEGEGRPEGKALEHYYRAEKIITEQRPERQHPEELVSITMERGNPSRRK
jgi:sporulation protein YlmC with PRC-barrel domain